MPATRMALILCLGVTFGCNNQPNPEPRPKAIDPNQAIRPHQEPRRPEQSLNPLLEPKYPVQAGPD